MHRSYANTMTALSKVFEHPHNLVSVGAPGTNTPWILRDNGVVLIDIKMKLTLYCYIISYEPITLYSLSYDWGIYVISTK